MTFFKHTPFDTDEFINDFDALSSVLLHFLVIEKKITLSRHSDFHLKVQTRVMQFEQAYQKAGNSVSKQFNHYVQTWKNCLNEENPERASSYIRYYHDPQHYQPKGCFDYLRPSMPKKIACGSTMLIGALGVIGGVIACATLPPLGIPLIAASCVAIVSAIAILAFSRNLKEDEFKEKERALFKDGISIVQEIAKTEPDNSDTFYNSESDRLKSITLA